MGGLLNGGFRDSGPEKLAIHPKGVPFRESSPENGMLPHLGRRFHDLGPEKLGFLDLGMYGFHHSTLEKGWCGWFGMVFVTPVPNNRPSS